jgi:nucleoside-diphosphate-sugar epimerase
MKTHTILGAGQVGTKLARLLGEKGHDVRLVRRSKPGPDMPGVTWMTGDITDPAFADTACEGASVVYNCTNPPEYHRWEEVLPPLVAAARGAAARAGARLVVLDNVYMYGHTDGEPMTESTPMRPCSSKGALRKRLAEELFEAHERGEVEVAVGRASDYFGPETPSAAVFRDRFFERLAAGRSVEMMGDPDQPHSYSYTPDVARGLAVLGAEEAAVGRVWHLPVAAQLSTRELIERFAELAGRPAKVRAAPGWLLRGAGLVVPLARALAEMTYQWEEPFIVDDSAFVETFGVNATPLDEAIATTLRAYGLSVAKRAA